PMFEPALLVGISDRDKFAAGLKGSREGLTDLYARLRDASGFLALPDLKWPEAKKTSLGKKGDLYQWPDVFAKTSLDEQVQLSLGVGDRVAVLSPSPDQAERLLTPRKREAKAEQAERGRQGPLAANRDRLVAGMVLNFPALIDVLLAWVDAAPGLVPANDEATKQIVRQVAKHAREVGEVLKCFKRAEAATYLDGAKLTTHLRLTFEDLSESPEPPRRR